jgi:hypothetical protein
MTSLASMFMLLALILHIWARQRQKLRRLEGAAFAIAWAIFLPLAVLSKETGIVFVLYVAAYEATLQRHLSNGFDLFGAWYLRLLLAACGITLAYMFSPAGAWLLTYDVRPFTLTQRLLTEARITWEYLHLIVLPALPDFGLYHDDFRLSKGLFAPVTTLYSLCGLAVLALVSWVVRIKWPLVSFAILWFLLGHSLESSIFPLELMHEHRNYLPSLGVFIVLVAVLQSSVISVPIYRVIAYTGISAFATYFVLLSHLRADLYGDDFRRTQIEAGYRPDSIRTRYEAGAVLVNMYKHAPEPLLAAFAEKEFERVSTLDPSSKLGLLGMLQLDCLSGRATRTAIFDELRRRLELKKWIPFDRTVMHAIAEMANARTICLDRRQIDELFMAAFSNNTTSALDRAIAYSDYAAGYLWLGQKDYAAAGDILRRATRENSNDVLNRLNLLQLYRLLGDRKGLFSMLDDLQHKRLGKRDQRFLRSIKRELVTEGVLVN